MNRGAHPAPHERIAALDWAALGRALWAQGHARTGPLLSAAECGALRGLWGDEGAFRKRISMERHRYGAGDYAYFCEPLPPLVRSLRTQLYRRLAPLANDWAEALGGTNGEAPAYPPTLADYLARCHAAGQTRPTPLLLRYGAGGYNCLHQDRYGEVAFPLQATVFLSRPGRDFDGGAFLLVEQRPRQQSRGEALQPAQGELVLFASLTRPVRGTRGWYRAGMRHGVSTVTRGTRSTLGIIFHDAR